MSNQKTCAIIGAGIAGIATAIRLANKGFQVKVFEANAYPGGKLSEISDQGYRFDAGPSLFTMPEYVEELFQISGKNPQAYFQYKKLELACRYFYEDGTVLNAYADLEKFAEEVAQKTQDSKTTVLKFLEKSAFKYKITADVFLKQSLHKFTNYLNYKTLRGILNFHRLDIFKTMNQVNEQTFSDARMVQFFNRYATYNGSDPYQTSGLMNVIPHLEFGVGAFFPLNGMHSITTSLVDLAQSLGVDFQLDTQVKEVLIEKNQAIGIEIFTTSPTPSLTRGESSNQSQKLYFDHIVSNMDVVNTYHKLLPKVKKPQKLLTQPKSSSAVIFYWGIRKNFPELELHNIFFSADYKNEFDTIFQKHAISSDPTIYINISSKEKPDDAPECCENWFVMVNAPNNIGQDWDSSIIELRNHILLKISRLLKTEIADLIETEIILDPRSIENRTSSSQGALYGNSSNNKYAAFLRHANFSSQIKNLYFCGGSVHPGGGIPLSLLSAKIASEFVR